MLVNVAMVEGSYLSADVGDDEGELGGGVEERLVVCCCPGECDAEVRGGEIV